LKVRLQRAPVDGRGGKEGNKMVKEWSIRIVLASSGTDRITELGLDLGKMEEHKY